MPSIRKKKRGRLTIKTFSIPNPNGSHAKSETKRPKGCAVVVHVIMSVPPLTRSWWCGGAVDGDDGSLSRCSSSTMVDLSHSPAATSTKMGDSFGLRRRRPLFIVVYVIMSAVLLYCITTNSSCCFAPFEFNDDGCIKVTAEYIIHHTYQSHTSRTILYNMILQRCRVDLSLCIDH